MTKAIASLLLLLMLCCPLGAGAQPRFDAQHVGGPNSGQDAELWMPNARPPVPAIVVLHGCDGMRPHYRDWARTLNGWGYAALMVDSFAPRGEANVCNRGFIVPPSERSKDAYRAAAYLRALPDIRPDRIGVIGFSHGGWTVLNLVLADKLAASGGAAFVAAVAYYPGCVRPDSPLITDTLILIGDRDDWTPAENCRQWVSRVQRNGRALDMQVYPGAYHAFDSTLALRHYMGHTLGRDDAAAAAALEATRQFLDERLQR